LSATREAVKRLNYTVRRKTDTRYNVVEVPSWALKRRELDLLLETEITLDLERFVIAENVHYKYSEKRERVEPSGTKRETESTGEKFRVTIPAGSRVRYLPKDSQTICFIANVVGPRGHYVQLAFDRAGWVRMTHYRAGSQYVE
jgi:hypothetical protein